MIDLTQRISLIMLPHLAVQYPVIYDQMYHQGQLLMP